ncbi:MAG: bifunctional 2',3'-cyclic-nucleotide 2'-phosphodiesterase/3'-nucleotidase [Ferrimonas sp.]
MMLRSCLSLLTAALISGCNPTSPTATGDAGLDADAPITTTLRILETADLHANVMDYNYYLDQPDITVGLARVAAVIATARSEVQNSVLVDNGDLIQGSAMGDYFAAKYNNADFEVHPVHKAMNTLDYVVGNLGNHEFNYGLKFLYQAVQGADFPYISANVRCAIDNCFGDKQAGDYLVAPYQIIPHSVIDSEGNTHTINIGYIGFVPPQIMVWDRANIAGRVSVEGIVESAQNLVPLMKAEGADIIIAIPHSGIGSAINPRDIEAENATFGLTTVAGIDAILFGHSHSVFPSAHFTEQAQSHKLDLEKGLINGIPAVMPGRWGDNLGQIDLTLEQRNGHWKVIDGVSKVRPIFERVQQQNQPTADVMANQAQITRIHQTVAAEHNATREYLNAPIGRANVDMYSFLALVQDDASVQIVADAQRDYLKTQLDPAYQQLPILSAAAPFKAGGRRASAGDSEAYVQVPAGELSYKNANDLYLYPNTVVAVKASGAQVRDWLECAALQYNTIDPQSSEPQELINWTFPTFNFDVLEGVNYQIDVTQAPKYTDNNCQTVANPIGRIVDLSYNAAGQTLQGDAFAQQQFIIVTNNYRAFGGTFAGTGAAHVVQEFPETNREALVAYIRTQSADGKTVNAQADGNWQLKALPKGSPAVVIVDTQDSALAAEFIATNQRWPMTRIGDDGQGFAQYQIDFRAP